MSDQYQFFHWHLEFPDVFGVPKEDKEIENQQTRWVGGFDIVLGNPPWERVKPQEKEWFSSKSPDVANAPTAALRKILIADIKNNNQALYMDFQKDLRKAEGDSHVIRGSSHYPLCGRGDINTYAVFAELNRQLINTIGRVGCILPSGIATDDTTKYYFQDVITTSSLVSLFDFENKLLLFQAVAPVQKFCLFVCGSGRYPIATNAVFVFFAHTVEDVIDESRIFSLSASDISLLNPNTQTCPIFRSNRDALITKAIYRRIPILIKEGPPTINTWEMQLTTMFHMSNDSRYLSCARAT